MSDAMPVFPPIVHQMAEDERLSPTDIKVYITASRFLDFLEARPLKALVVAKEMRLHPTHVAKSLRRLVQAGYLLADRRVGVGGIPTYRIPFSRSYAKSVTSPPTNAA